MGFSDINIPWGRACPPRLVEATHLGWLQFCDVYCVCEGAIGSEIGKSRLIEPILSYLGEEVSYCSVLISSDCEAHDTRAQHPLE